MKPSTAILVTCEHASNAVPAAYRSLFTGHTDVLKTHRAYDLGIAPLARRLARQLAAPYLHYRWTRLLIEPNRTRPQSWFSEFSRALPPAEQQILIQRYYQPYRQAVLASIHQELQTHQHVLHLSMHSFTPIRQGRQRNLDIGLLYDPGRSREKALAVRLQKALQTHLSLRVRRNAPYRGVSDGITTWLRHQFPARQYLGLELEFNQALLAATPLADQHQWCKLLTTKIQN